MKIQESTPWIENLGQAYSVKIESKEPGNYFVTSEFHFSDPNGVGLSFTVGFNSEDKASFLAIDEGNIGRLNIAEGYTSEDILKVADSILQGSARAGRTSFLKRPTLTFSTSQGDLTAKLKRLPNAYTRKG